MTEKRMYYYGIVFWNEKSDDEIFAFFRARNYFDAEDIAKPVEVPGYIKGVVTYIGDKDRSYYDTDLAELMAQPKSN